MFYEKVCQSDESELIMMLIKLHVVVDILSTGQNHSLSGKLHHI